MNDTNLNDRQKKILEILRVKDAVSRFDLTKAVSETKNLSKITLIRDLNYLTKQGFVKKTGNGKNIRYGLMEKNPLLTYLNLTNYFNDDQRINTRKEFNTDVFTHLNNLYSAGEKALWEKSRHLFAEAKDKLDPSIYKRELERFIIELSWKSSQIEGNTYSLIETETLIKQNIRAKGHPEDEAVMILNHKQAFEAILKHSETFKKLDYSDIIQLHQVLTKGLVTAGIRSQKVRISGTSYIPLSDKNDIETKLRQLIQHINNLYYPPEKALVVAVMIAYLQPFADGNKRTARMLANALLLAFDYFPLSYRNVDVNEYRSAMVIFYETNNLFNFKRIFMQQLDFAIGNYFL